MRAVPTRVMVPTRGPPQHAPSSAPHGVQYWKLLPTSATQVSPGLQRLPAVQHAVSLVPHIWQAPATQTPPVQPVPSGRLRIAQAPLSQVASWQSGTRGAGQRTHAELDPHCIGVEGTHAAPRKQPRQAAGPSTAGGVEASLARAASTCAASDSVAPSSGVTGN